MHLNRRQRAALCILGGVLNFQAFPEWDLWPLAWFCLVPTLIAIDGVSPRAAFGWGWLHGFVTNLGGFYWVVHLLVTFGHLPPPVGWLGFALLAAYQGFVFALFAGLSRWLEDGARALGRPIPRPLVRVTAFVAAEHAVPFIFPWYLANSQWNFPLATQICDLLGVLGLTALLVASSALLVERTRRSLIALAVLVALDLGYGAVRLRQVDAAMAAAPKVRIGMVEGDIGISEKARPEHVANNLSIHQRLSRILADAGAELIVWPESAYNSFAFPVDIDAVPPSGVPLPPHPGWDALKLGPGQDHLVLDAFPALTDTAADRAAGVRMWDHAAPMRGFRTPLLLGVVTTEPEPNPVSDSPRWQRRMMNSALLLDSEGRVDSRVYHKNYLLIFGEYIPFGRMFPWIYDLIPEANSFIPGDDVTVFELALPAAPALRPANTSLRAGVMICYEAIIPRWTRKLVGKRDPNVLINITNDAWFGKKGEPWLHMVLTTFRAIENRRALVRSTNTGISVFVDAAGRLVSRTSVDHPEVLMAQVPLLELPTLYRLIGDLIGWLALGFLALLALIALNRRHPAATDAAAAAPDDDVTRTPAAAGGNSSRSP